MRSVIALLALVAIASAAVFTLPTDTASVDTVFTGTNGVPFVATTPTATGAMVVGGPITVDTSNAIAQDAPLAAFYVWIGDGTATCASQDTLAKVQAANLYVSAVKGTTNWALNLKPAPQAADVSTLVICYSDGTTTLTGANLAIIKAPTPAATLVDSIAKIGGGPFIYGDKVKFSANADGTTAFAAGNILTLGAIPADASAAALAAVGGVVTTAANTVDGGMYMGAASATVAAWGATGGIQTAGAAQTKGSIVYLAETSTATLTMVDAKAMPEANYTVGRNITFKLVQNNTAQGEFFHVWAAIGGDAAGCDTAIAAGGKALLVANNVDSMKWMVPATVGVYDIWVKSANASIACTKQAFGALTVVAKPAPVPTAAAPTAAAPTAVTPTAAAATTTGTSGASAVRGGLVAAFACVLAGLGLTAAF